MASNLESIQNGILAYLDDNLAQPVVEQGIPDAETVLRNAAGNIDPYIAVQFGDIQQGRAHSMIGPRGDDYILPLYFQCVGPTPAIARGVQNRLLDLFLGAKFPWAGNVRKRPGGGMFSVTNSSASTEAYMMPSSFGIVVQFE